MKYKVYTGVVTEPVSLAEVKLFLKLDSVTYAEDVATTQLLAPASRGIATYTSSGVDVLGKSALVNLNAGTNQAGGTVSVHIEESDDNITYTDWTGGAFTQVTTADDNAIQEIQYTGTKRYIRVVAVVAGAACEFSVDAIVNSGETAEDTLLSALITAAREYGEDYTGHAFASQTVDYYLDDFPTEDFIEWVKGPLTSVSSVKYKNSAGTETTMTVTTQYLVDTNTFPGKIFLPYSVDWPSFTPYPYDAVTIRGVCGYSTLPYQYKQAMLLHIGFLYKYRDNAIPPECMTTINRLYNMRRVVNI